MDIDWTALTPGSALAGGVLIGIAVACSRFSAAASPASAAFSAAGDG
jgi:hypothetical protein